MNIAVRFWLSLFAAGTACVLTNCVPPSAPDVDQACGAACLQREHLGCVEPYLADACYPVCKRAVARHLFDPTCAAHATTVDAMQACNVRCGR